jgi:hypothetical protein
MFMLYVCWSGYQATCKITFDAPLKIESHDVKAISLLKERLYRFVFAMNCSLGSSSSYCAKYIISCLK